MPQPKSNICLSNFLHTSKNISEHGNCYLTCSWVFKLQENLLRFLSFRNQIRNPFQSYAKSGSLHSYTRELNKSYHFTHLQFHRHPFVTSPSCSFAVFLNFEGLREAFIHKAVSCKVGVPRQTIQSTAGRFFEYVSFNSVKRFPRIKTPTRSANWNQPTHTARCKEQRPERLPSRIHLLNLIDVYPTGFRHWFIDKRKPSK